MHPWELGEEMSLWNRTCCHSKGLQLRFQKAWMTQWVGSSLCINTLIFLALLPPSKEKKKQQITKQNKKTKKEFKTKIFIAKLQARTYKLLFLLECPSQGLNWSPSNGIKYLWKQGLQTQLLCLQVPCCVLPALHLLRLSRVGLWNSDCLISFVGSRVGWVTVWQGKAITW